MVRQKHIPSLIIINNIGWGQNSQSQKNFLSPFLDFQVVITYKNAYYKKINV